MHPNRKHMLALIILDGFGYREEKDANAIAAAQKPNWDQFWNEYPHTLISGSGKCVGLPEGQMGNSEVGHLNMGAGRIVRQDLARIDNEIETGDFFHNEILTNALLQAKSQHKAVHVLGLVSPGGVHSHENHILALIRLAKQLNFPNLYIHAFLDGRDTPPRSAMDSLHKVDELCKELKVGKIVSLIGRFYAMDRDKRWDRIQKAYDLITLGLAPFHAITAKQGLELAYARGESDEFVNATAIHPDNELPIRLEDDDSIIFMNFRADRARELTQSFTQADFKAFEREKIVNLASFICLSQYDKRYELPVAYPPQILKNIFAECVSEAGLKQLRIAETEKYAHVTFFFNGGIEERYPGEERILIPSPKVATYDLCPEMSAFELTDQFIKAIESREFDVIICNFANPDMVGHTGNFAATVEAISAIDVCLGRIIQSLQAHSGEAIITADHGNAEQMFDYTTNQAHTAHTSDPVPFVYIGRKAKIAHKNGKLSDIAPTMLHLLEISQPSVMTGSTLVKLV